MGREHPWFDPEKAVTQALAELESLVDEIIGEDEEVTRIDRKTDEDVPKESRNELRTQQRTALKAIFKQEV